MEISAPRARLPQASVFPRIARSFRRPIFVFLQKSCGEKRKYRGLNTQTIAVKALAEKRELHNHSTIPYNPSTLPYNPSTIAYKPSTIPHNPSTFRPNSSANPASDRKHQCDAECR